MTSNQKTVENFYQSFKKADWQSMANCYHQNAIFNDPVFTNLRGKEIGFMWRMLIEKSKGNLTITFSNVEVNENRGFATWQATYFFGKSNRKVVNTIKANFIFKDGLILKHTDSFKLYAWTIQAFGLTGLLLGWTPIFKSKIRNTMAASLKKYMAKNMVEINL